MAACNGEDDRKMTYGTHPSSDSHAQLVHNKLNAVHEKSNFMFMRVYQFLLLTRMYSNSSVGSSVK